MSDAHSLVLTDPSGQATMVSVLAETSTWGEPLGVTNALAAKELVPQALAAAIALRCC